jgi:hypothetical protein
MKTQQCGSVFRRGHLQQSSGFRRCRYHPWGHSSPKVWPVEQEAGIQAKTVVEPRKSSNAGPYVDGDTSDGVRVFAAVDITPRNICHRKVGRKGPRDA